MTDPRYPDISVQLVGADGNAYNILGIVQRPLRRAGVDQATIDEFLREATSSDYDHLLVTVMRWVDVE